MSTITDKCKKSYARFQAWKQSGPQFKVKDETVHTCVCCGHEFMGNYCPVCGQKDGKRRITWGTLRESTLDLWGLGTRSMPYSIWHLLLRPGYFIADYISGKRQVSFPPVKMLFFVTVIVLLVESVFGVDNTIEHTTEVAMKTDKVTEVVNLTIDWIADHPAWGSLIMISFFILPTYLICREAPRCRRHTLPEGFFIQVFVAVEMSVWNFVSDLLPDIKFLTIMYALLVMLGLVWFRTYYQLFGYSVWGTIWRLAAVWWSGLMLIFTIVFVEIVLYRWLILKVAVTYDELGTFVIGLLVMATLSAVGLLLAWYIDHRRAKRLPARPEPAPVTASD